MQILVKGDKVNLSSIPNNISCNRRYIKNFFERAKTERAKRGSFMVVFASF